MVFEAHIGKLLKHIEHWTNQTKNRSSIIENDSFDCDQFPDHLYACCLLSMGMLVIACPTSFRNHQGGREGTDYRSQWYDL